MICIGSTVGNPYVSLFFVPIWTIRNLLITTYLHQLNYRWHPVCSYACLRRLHD